MDEPKRQSVRLAEPASAMTVDGRNVELAAGLELARCCEGPVWIFEDRARRKYCGNGPTPRTTPIEYDESALSAPV